MSKTHLDLVLNTIEQGELTKFADNPVMFEAVRKAILHFVYFQGVLRPGESADATTNFALQLAATKDKSQKTNEQVGADLIARWEGVNLVESGLKEIEEYRSPVVGSEDKVKNPAR